MPEHKTRDDVELTWKSSTSLTMIIPTNQNAEFDLIHLQQKGDNSFPSFGIIFKFFAIVLVFAYGPYRHLVESKQGE